MVLRYNLVLLKKWNVGMNKDNVVFDGALFWVQLWHLPTECRTLGIVKAIGNRIGTFLEWDCCSNTSEEQRFVRICVGLSIGKALLRGGKLPTLSGERALIAYKYERLRTTCWYCGLLGHDERSCALKIKDELSGVYKELPYGNFLKGSKPNSTEKKKGRTTDHYRDWQNFPPEGVRSDGANWCSTAFTAPRADVAKVGGHHFGSKAKNPDMLIGKDMNMVSSHNKSTSSKGDDSAWAQPTAIMRGDQQLSLPKITGKNSTVQMEVDPNKESPIL